ncbi:MAG: FAD-dependent oxidoreductase, partial [Holophagales bacterium]|nr:FAD-dependent oxidoreductase [Holophagales bacterium]
MKIAIIGTGISGLVAAHRLHGRHELTLFEAGRHVGGHTYTVPVHEGAKQLPVDMGFIVYNERTYPHFTRLLARLGVATEASDMSFSVSHVARDFEYCGSSLNQLFAQRSNLLRPSFYRMVLGILAFHRRAEGMLELPAGVTFGQYLEREGLRGPLVDHYLVPMIAAIWSTEAGRMLEFPARTLARFLHNHGMLTVHDRPQWRVVSGGSREYVKALTAPFRDRILLATPAEHVRRLPEAGTGAEEPRGVEVVVGGESVPFDAVILATHSDQALRLLGEGATAEERQVLGAIPYQPNDAVLHTDRRLLPRRRRAWASWNYHLGTEGVDRQVGGTKLTYWMNRLQNLRSDLDYCVTLNRTAEIDPETILHRVRMDHPLFTAESDRAKSRWAEISRGRTYFSGAYWGFGFHEDG